MALIGLLLLSLLGQDDTKPLPELKAFLAEFRKTLHTNNLLLSQYTYTERETRVELDSGGKPKKTEVKVYQILRGSEPEDIYRRLLSKNGKPVDPKELEKQDRERQKRMDERERKRKKKTPAELEKERSDEKREDDKIIDDIFALYAGQLLGREHVEGRAVIRLSFKARSGYKPKTREGKILQKIAGQAWVSEDDHELVRVDAEAIENISVGLGLLGKLNKGSRITGERLKVHDEVWLPSRIDILVNARVLLLKGFHFREIVEYSDHKKFNVETILTFPDLENPQP
jgi:hypothetical protein